MANELGIQLPTGGLTNLYAVIQLQNEIVNATTGALQSLTSGNWTTAAIALADSSSNGKYFASAPAGMVANQYGYLIYQNASPAWTDSPISGVGQIPWNGTSEITSPAPTVAQIQLGLAIQSTLVSVGNEVVALGSPQQAGQPVTLPVGTGDGQIELSAGKVTVGTLPNPAPNGYGGVTISGTAASPGQPGIDGTIFKITVDYPIELDLTLNGLDSTDWTQFCATIKAKPTDPDSSALVLIAVSNPPSGSDGLILLNGAAPVSPATNADGSIIVNGVTTNTSLTIKLTAAGASFPAACPSALSYYLEVTSYIAGVKAPVVARGTIVTTRAIRQTVGQA